MGKTKAELVPYRYPKIEVVHQVDFPRNDEAKHTRDPETNIHKYGCRFMSMLAIPQFVIGKALKKNQILGIYNEAVSGNLGPNVMEYDCTCLADEHKVMYLASKLLGKENVKVKQIAAKVLVPQSDDDTDWNMEAINGSTLPGKGHVYFIVVGFRTGSTGNYGGRHFCLFNATGELIYDPARGTVNLYKYPYKLHYYKVRIE